MNTPRILVGVGALATAGALLLSGCSSSGSVHSSGSSGGTSAASSASSSASASAESSTSASSGSSSTAAAPGTAKSWSSEPPMKIDTSKKYTMTLKTSQGEIVIALNAAKAPHTVNSFNFLAGQKYFDGTHCHRLTTTGIYVLQCGDPTGTGSGGPGYQFQDENLAGATYPAGTVAMANAGPGTNGSQFFIVYQDTQLPPSYTPFGTVTSGLDVVKTVAAGGTDNANGQGDGAPNTRVVLNSVTVTAG